MRAARVQRLSPTATLDAAQEQRRLLYVFTYLAALTAVQILHLALDAIQLNIGFSLGLTAGFLYSYYLQPRYRALTIYADSLVAVGLAIYYFLRLQREPAMYGNYLGILLGILIVLLSFKAYAPSDFCFLLIPCLVSLMFSSVASYDIKFMLLLPLFLIFAGSALYMANQVDVAMRVANTARPGEALRIPVGAAFLKILLRAIAGIILTSVVIYIVVPHSGQANRALILNTAPRVEDTENVPAAPNTQGGNGTELGGPSQVGLSEDFDLAHGSELTSDPKPVMRVRSNSNGYMRAQVFDVYTGSGWVKSGTLDPKAKPALGLIQLESHMLPLQPHSEAATTYSVPLLDFPSHRAVRKLRAQHIQVTKDNIYSDTDPEQLNFDIVRQEITLLAPQPPFYFAAYQPFRLENISLSESGLPLDEPMLDKAACLRSVDLSRAHPARFSFTVYSLAPRISTKRLKQVYTNGPAEIVSRYTQLPLSQNPGAEELQLLGIDRDEYRPISQRLARYAETVVDTAFEKDGSPAVYEKVQAIYKHLTDSKEFKYSLTYKQLNPDQEVTEAFLLGTQEGYCRYFASAMAVLCRINGIPARVVSGYAPGTYSLVNNAYIVAASNAHAWVEVYFDEYGWVMFDPSPTSNDLLTRQGFAEQVSNVVDFLQELFVVDPAGTQETIRSALSNLWAWTLDHLPLAISSLSVIVMLLIIYYLLRQLRRYRRPERFEPENDVVAAYARLLDQLGRLGTRREASATARAFLGTVAQRLPALAGPLAEFVPVYEKSAFTPSGPGAEDLKLARDITEQVERFVADELKRRQRQK